MPDPRPIRRAARLFSRDVAGLLLLLLTLTASVARAEPPRATDPAFASALSLWLADDDATSLPEFARLAASGDLDAQLLLGLIDTTPSLQGPWLATLPRAERVALMRRPGGISGQSWLPVAADHGSDLAAAWLALRDAAAAREPEAFQTFAALGEPRAARLAVLTIALRQRRGLDALASSPVYPPDLRFLAWREWAADEALAPRIMREVSALPPGDPQRARYSGAPAARADTAHWLETAPEAEPLRAFCAAACPDSAGCSAALLDLRDGLGAVGSPVESLVSSAEWQSSPRGRASLIRPPSRYPAATGNACLESELATEAARFGQ